MHLDESTYTFVNKQQNSIETGKESAFGGQSKYTSNVVSELCMPYTFPDADKHLIEKLQNNIRE